MHSKPIYGLRYVCLDRAVIMESTGFEERNEVSQFNPHKNWSIWLGRKGVSNGLGHYKVCINTYLTGEYDSHVKVMLFPPKKAAIKSPKVHPHFNPSALILVFASQFPVPPLKKKKKNLSCQGNPGSSELAGFSTTKKSYGKPVKVTIRNG